MADNLQATPQKRPNIGALAQLLKRIDEFGRKPFGYDNPPVQMLSDLLGVPGTQRTLERLAYGEALTEPRGVLKEDTVDALFNAPGALGKLAGATKGLPIGAVIKPKGGNWLEGSVEGALKGLKNPYVDKYAAELERWGSPEQARQWVADPGDNARAINNWVDKQLTRYVKNEMATPEDPIRALAEKGVLHYRPEVLPGPRERAIDHRFEANQIPYGLAKSRLAQDFETVSDASIAGHPASQWMANASDKVIEANPWIAKMPPESILYEKTNPSMAQDLGFDHLMDELRNAINPASGLPPELLLKYSSLPQVSVPQAVERVAKINEWRAAQKAEADLARANNAATVLHKDYPEQGFKWVELKNPESRSINEMNESHRQALADALKYEGDTMGHCVGGYCDDVASGKSRIYSLRDAKGQPHVTIEVKPEGLSRENAFGRDVNYENFADYLEGVRPEGNLSRLVEKRGGDFDELFTNAPEGSTKLNEFLASQYPEEAAAYAKLLSGDVPRRIVQIKGKANRAPNPEYLPFVQDFVKSGKWSDVGDLRNAGLVKSRDLNHAGITRDEFDAFIARHGEYATPDEAARLPPDPQGLDDGPYGGNMEPEGFARGGPVTAKDPIRLMAEKYAAHCPSLRNHALHKGR